MEEKVLLSVAVAVVLVVLSKLRSMVAAKPKPKLNLPPGPWMLPVIGSIHHLVSSPLLHRAMRGLAQKHGPLMRVRLGEVPAVVVSSPEAAMAIMKTNDVTFADRPLMFTTISVLTFHGNDLVFAPYGERWRQLRKISMLELLSAARVQSYRPIREDEVARFMQNLAAPAGGAAVNISKMISRFINDTFVRESVGGRCKYQDEYLDALDTAVRQTAVLTLADVFPSSKLMQLLGSAPRKARACLGRITRILELVIQEKKEAVEKGDETLQDSGMLGVLLKLQQERSTSVELTNDTIVALMFDLFAGGSETSSTTLGWCMAELMRHPAARAKAQAELREAFKGKSRVTEEDLAMATPRYLKLVIKEALRLHTPFPLLLPRQCRESCQVMGYDIPKGTSVFINAWAISRDPRYWDDAEEFRPERFAEEKSGVEYKGTDYEYLPFGAGRRMCPGMNLGVANIELALASLLYHFDWNLPDGMEAKDIDVVEAVGLVSRKKIDLIVHPLVNIAPAAPATASA